MPIKQTEDLATALYAAGYALGTLDDTPLAGLAGSPAWHSFEASYANLARDTFMADGGTYRYRRYAEFLCDGATGGVTRLPHVAYTQSKQINKLNGGTQRMFAPIEDVVADGEVPRKVLGWAATLMTGHTGTPSWKAQCFQNRILARSAEAGLPTPEGVHRDGVDVVLTLMVRRHNVKGGVSGIYPADRPGRPVIEAELSEPGELLLNDDERTMHGVTPITPTGDCEGYRDVFIAIFTGLQTGAGRERP
jgi:hypothetical protein